MELSKLEQLVLVSHLTSELNKEELHGMIGDEEYNKLRYKIDYYIDAGLSIDELKRIYKTLVIKEVKNFLSE